MLATRRVRSKRSNLGALLMWWWWGGRGRAVAAPAPAPAPAPGSNKTMRGGGRLRPLAAGQLLRRIDTNEHIPFISDLADLVNQGPVSETESKLKALEARISALETA